MIAVEIPIHGKIYQYLLEPNRHQLYCVARREHAFDCGPLHRYVFQRGERLGESAFCLFLDSKARTAAFPRAARGSFDLASQMITAVPITVPITRHISSTERLGNHGSSDGVHLHQRPGVQQFPYGTGRHGGECRRCRVQGSRFRTHLQRREARVGWQLRLVRNPHGIKYARNSPLARSEQMG